MDKELQRIMEELENVDYVEYDGIPEMTNGYIETPKQESSTSATLTLS